jgi:hypothetical protein
LAHRAGRVPHSQQANANQDNEQSSSNAPKSTLLFLFSSPLLTLHQPLNLLLHSNASKIINTQISFREFAFSRLDQILLEDPTRSVAIVLYAEGLWVEFGTVLEDAPVVLDDFDLANEAGVRRGIDCAEVAGWVLTELSGVECFVGEDQDVGVVLFITYDELPEIDGSCDVEGILRVDPHSVEILKPGDPEHGGVLFDIPKETHSLEVPMPEGLVSG